MMTEDAEYFYSRIKEQAGTNQIVVVFDDRCCKVAREDYYPDKDGVVTFHKKIDWSDEGYSVAEVFELIKKYYDRIMDLKFESYDGEFHPIVNVVESDSIGDMFEFNCFVVVGDKNKSMKIYGNPDNLNWTSDKLNVRRGFNY